MSKYKYVMQTS